ncbi:hypothetical protein [Nesterenkonia rhizosphaerae]|uniref:Uncharacterized protein n=1 Tax=Nesterenkonia rhizosphaerae TaxID=1348272 RepID=A0ABP9G974_9MICC
MTDLTEQLEAEHQIITAAALDGTLVAEPLRALRDGELHIVDAYEVINERGSEDWEHVATFKNKQSADLFIHAHTALSVRNAQIQAALEGCIKLTLLGMEGSDFDKGVAFAVDTIRRALENAGK